MSLYNKFIYLLFYMFIAFAPNAFSCEINFNFDNDWQFYELDEFTFYYTFEGIDAIDYTDKNTVPNIVKDVALQLTSARDVLASLSYVLPLDSQRYRSQNVNNISVFFKHIDGNGAAFDQVRKLPNGECTLLMYISNDYKTGSLTPTHELFHLIQYGYTMLKAGWYLEGLARWSETVLGRPIRRPTNIPYSDKSLKEFWESTYTASRVWLSIINSCDKTDPKIDIPDHLLGLKYTDGSKVVVDEYILGHKFVLRLLENLSELDKKISEKEGFERFRWHDKEQRDLRFSDQIWQTAIDTCAKM